jgi:hypothetical protein
VHFVLSYYADSGFRCALFMVEAKFMSVRLLSSLVLISMIGNPLVFLVCDVFASFASFGIVYNFGASTLASFFSSTYKVGMAQLSSYKAWACFLIYSEYCGVCFN